MSLDVHLYVEVDLGGDAPERITLPHSDLNITHNVTPMWRAAGCYEALYKSDGDEAGQHVAALRVALADMQDRRAFYRALNPANGWGDADGARDWLGRWIDVCARYPKARIAVSS